MLVEEGHHSWLTKCNAWFEQTAERSASSYAQPLAVPAQTHHPMAGRGEASMLGASKKVLRMRCKQCNQAL